MVEASEAHPLSVTYAAKKGSLFSSDEATASQMREEKDKCITQLSSNKVLDGAPKHNDAERSSQKRALVRKSSLVHEAMNQLAYLMPALGISVK